MALWTPGSIVSRDDQANIAVPADVELHFQHVLQPGVDASLTPIRYTTSNTCKPPHPLRSPFGESSPRRRRLQSLWRSSPTLIIISVVDSPPQVQLYIPPTSRYRRQILWSAYSLSLVESSAKCVPARRYVLWKCVDAYLVEAISSLSNCPLSIIMRETTPCKRAGKLLRLRRA
jgi:hypothetical protein